MDNNFWYDAVRRYYLKGYYTNEQMKIFVLGKKITEEQYKEITGIEYVETKDLVI